MIIERNVFVFTGRFVYGPRTSCEKAVRDLGGDCADNITRKVSYLVLGDVGSRDWIHSTYGTKIEKAVAYRTSGVPLQIISEDHWAKHVD